MFHQRTCEFMKHSNRYSKISDSLKAKFDELLLNNSSRIMVHSYLEIIQPLPLEYL